MIYLVNAKLIPCDGLYRRETITAQECWDMLKSNEYVSTIGYPETAAFISDHIEKPVEMNRDRVIVEPGDVMMSVSLKYRVRNPGDKGKVLGNTEDDYEYCKITREE